MQTIYRHDSRHRQKWQRKYHEPRVAVTDGSRLLAPQFVSGVITKNKCFYFMMKLSKWKINALLIDNITISDMDIQVDI